MINSIIRYSLQNRLLTVFLVVCGVYLFATDVFGTMGFFDANQATIRPLVEL